MEKIVNGHIIKKIFLVLFPHLHVKTKNFYNVIDYSGMPHGEVNYYSISYDSDISTRYEIKLYTEKSCEPNDLVAYKYTKSKKDETTVTDEWHIISDHSKEAASIYDKLIGGLTTCFDPHGLHDTYLKTTLDGGLDVRCPTCTMGFIDIHKHIINDKKIKIFVCPICNTKLSMFKKINIEYKISVNKKF